MNKATFWAALTIAAAAIAALWFGVFSPWLLTVTGLQVLGYIFVVLPITLVGYYLTFGAAAGLIMHRSMRTL